MAGVSPRLVVRDTRGWGESQAGDIRFYTLRYLSPGLGGVQGWYLGSLVAGGKLRLETLGFILFDA